MHRFRVVFAILLATLFARSPVLAGDGEGAVDIGYFALKPSIVSNLVGGPKYIRCDIQLMTEKASMLPKIELHAPALRHQMLMLLAKQDGQSLTTRAGKEGLRKAALQSFQEQLKELTGDEIVADLYFTAYYVR
jgi:flagellar FliL protein